HLEEWLLRVFRIGDCYFFFSSRRRHTRSDRDWSSDVCSSDLSVAIGGPQAPRARAMTICWTSSVPSPMVRILASRYIRQTGYSRSEERRVGKECRSRWSP